jgi:hypothetical protein
MAPGHPGPKPAGPPGHHGRPAQLRPFRIAAISNPGPDRDRPGPLDQLCRTLVPHSSPTTGTASSPPRHPEPGTASANASGARPPHPPGHRHALAGPPHRQRLHHPSPAPARSRRGQSTGRPAGHTGRCTPSRRPWRHRAARPWPSVETRRCAPTVLTACTDGPNSPDARPLYVRGQRNTTVDTATR